VYVDFALEGIVENMKGAPVDGTLHVPDASTLEMVFRLLHEHGLFVGASSALNVCAAVQLSKILGAGSNVVTVLCDGAGRYQSRLFNKDWLQSKGLWDSLASNYKAMLSTQI